MPGESTNIQSALPDIKGSTLIILRALYESLIPNKNSRSKAKELIGDNFDNLLIFDTEAAIAYSKLKKIDELSYTTTLIDEGISRLPDDRKKDRDPYLQENFAVSSQISQLNDEFLQGKIIPVYNDIRRLHQEIRALIPEDTKPLSKEAHQTFIDKSEEIKKKTIALRKLVHDYNSKFTTIQITQSEFYKKVTRKDIAEATSAIAALPTPNKK